MMNKPSTTSTNSGDLAENVAAAGVTEHVDDIAGRDYRVERPGGEAGEVVPLLKPRIRVGAPAVVYHDATHQYRALPLRGR